MRNKSYQGKIGSINEHGTKKTTNIEEHGGLKEMHGDIRITLQQHGTIATRIKIKVT